MNLCDVMRTCPSSPCHVAHTAVSSCCTAAAWLTGTAYTQPSGYTACTYSDGVWHANGVGAFILLGLLTHVHMRAQVKERLTLPMALYTSSVEAC